MSKKIEKYLEREAKAKRRRSALRETVLLRFQQIPYLRKLLEFVADLLAREAGTPPDPQVLGESVVRAEVRAAAAELRHLQEFLAEVANRLKWLEGNKHKPLDPADRRLCEFAEEQRREIMRRAARYERRVGPAPVRRSDTGLE